MEWKHIPWKRINIYSSVEKNNAEISILISAGNGKDLEYCKVKDADKKTTLDIYFLIDDFIQKIKRNKFTLKKNTQHCLKFLPNFLIDIALILFDLITNNLGISLKAIGYDKHNYGTILITNVGSFGFESLFAPLLPYSGVPISFTVGSIVKKPKIVDGELQIRECVDISATIDHRYTDGARGYRILNKFREYVSDPEKYLNNRESTFIHQQIWCS